MIKFIYIISFKLIIFEIKNKIKPHYYYKKDLKKIVNMVNFLLMSFPLKFFFKGGRISTWWIGLS